MSGVVVKLNDDEASDDEDDTGLLPASRGYDDDDDDFDEDIGIGQSGSGNKSRGQSVLKRLRGNKKIPYPAMRSGTVMQLLNTLTICCIFFGMGLTKSLIESPPTADGIHISDREMATSVGYVLGFLFGGFLLSRFSRNFIMLLTLQVLGSMLITVPWISSDWSTDSVYIIIGVSLAILMIGGNVICLDFWGRKSGPYIQALHFCLSLGLLTGPLLVDPLSQTHVPNVLQKALPFALSHQGAISTSHSLHKREVVSAVQEGQSSTLDPLLVNIFGADLPKTTASSTTVKVPKPKPVFNDGQKLDNSIDWEKVKVAQPSEEEIIATTLAPEEEETEKEDHKKILVKTTTDTASMIKKEINNLEDDIKQNEQILTWLNKMDDKTVNRGKREKRGLGGGFGVGPPVYSQNRRLPPSQMGAQMGAYLPSQIVPQSPVMPGPRQGIRYPSYSDYDYDIGPPYGQIGPSRLGPAQLDPPKDLPENVEEALGTINNYLANPNQNVSDTTTTTKKPKRITTTVAPKTTIRTTTKPSIKTAVPTTRKLPATTLKIPNVTSQPKRKKPTSSIDDAKENSEGNNNVTIKSFLVNHGVSKNNIGFILDATYTWIISLILLICMCYRPQRGEPRSRQEADEVFGNRASEESRIFKATFTVLLFFFNLMHWGMFISFSQTLPQFKILASTAKYLERVFVGVFTATRFLAILTAGILNPAVGIFISLFIIFVGSLVLVFTQQISAAAVWAGVILQAVGLATLLPTTLVWGEAYVLMSSHVVAIVCWGLALAELMVPYSMKLLSLDMQSWLGLAMVGATTLSAGLFTCVFLLARRHGSRFSRPQASGYELANCQDDLNQELLEDDDDDFEIAEPSLELSGTHA